MKSIDVTIIVPVYNVEPFIAECIESVMAQTADAAIECLLVDDRGSDRSVDIAREMISVYSGPIEFRIIERERNGGLSAARNTGIRNARGRYIYFLDSDDLITPDCIAVLYKAARNYPEAQIVVGSMESFPDKEKFQWMADMLHGLPQFSDNIRWIRSRYLQSIPVISWNKLESRKFILDNDLFFREGILHEDEHWSALSYPHVRAIAFVDRVTYLYRLREGSITNSRGTELRKVENMTLILQEMFSRRTEWDRPLFMWAIWWLEYLAGADLGNSEANVLARENSRKLYHTLMSNPDVPVIGRATAAIGLYYKLPRGRHFLEQRLLHLAFGREPKFAE